MKLGKFLSKVREYQKCISSHSYWTPRLSKNLSYNERHILENYIKGNNCVQIKYAQLDEMGLLDNLMDILF